MIDFPADSYTICVRNIYSPLSMKILPIGKSLWLLLSCTCGIFLFIGGPAPDSLRSIKELWNLGHIICFALWGYGYSWWRQRPFPRGMTEVLVFAFCSGALTELIQSQIGRDASFEDLWHDVIGGFLGFLFLFCWRTNRYWQRLLTALCLAAVTFGLLIPTFRATFDDLVAWYQFPLLAGFESRYEGLRWSGSASRKVVNHHAISGHHAMRVKFSTQRYSGITLHSVHQNWKSHALLHLQVFNPGVDQFVLYIRIDDKLHNNEYTDRFNSSFTIRPGVNTLEIPLATVEQAPKNRLLDLSQVTSVGLFVGKLTTPRILYVDDVRLIAAEK